MKQLLLTFTIAVFVAFYAISNQKPVEFRSFTPVPNAPTLNSTSTPRVSQNQDREFKKLADFRKETLSILEALPKNQTEENEDSHYPPPELLKSSESLGRVLDVMKSDASLRSTGIAFYKNCALKSDVLDQVRALCLRNMYDWLEKVGTPTNSKEFPSNIEHLASFIPRTLIGND